MLDTAHRMPRLTEPPEITDPGPYLMHPASYYSYNTGAAAPPANFENVASYGNFVKTASHYDEMPPCAGAIWDRFPERTKWDSLVPYRPWDRGQRQPRNLRGRKAAAAYRDDGTEPFHYIVMSYDPRGRVEALLRFTENLGFDAVYYTYNSANGVICSRVVDAQRQYVTWYGYDDNGRVDSVWTKMTEPGTGFGLDNLKIPDSPARSETPDIVYSYDKRGNIDTVKFVPAFVTQSFAYNPRGWVDSMTAKGQYDDILFRQKFERDPGGNILKQVSKHAGRDELTQTYRYDRLYRLDKWSDGRDSVEYEYDRMGNRLAETKNLADETDYGYGMAGFGHRLSAVTRGGETRHYTYNNLGAVTSIASMSGNDTITSERFGYGGDGRIKRYTKKLFSATPETYDWRYRYSALGGREQKRLYYNTKGDSINGGSYNYYGWTYYMLGAGGEQLAVYKGVQAAHEDSSGHAGRRVYMYNESYISLGGTLVTLPDNTKQFNAMDNIGSVRLTVSLKDENLSMEHFDYKPFGDTLNAEGESRIGYAAQERDEESRYFAMGVRQYDPLSGRFLSVDPLYESFPDKTPYHYCNNNPISFKDPSGLSPEGEKGKEDEVQVVEQLKEMRESRLVDNMIKEFDEQQDAWQRIFSDQIASYLRAMNEEAIGWHERMLAFGGGGGGSRIGRDLCGTIKNGLKGKHAGTLVIPTPEKWDTESIEKACEKGGAYEYLENMSQYTDLEIGFFLIFNESKNELRAEFYIGNAYNQFIAGKEPPKGMVLSAEEMAIGMVHMHRGACGADFTDKDRDYISKFTNGEFEWTNRPNLYVRHNNDIWPNELDSKYADRTYFAVTNNEGRRSSFSWRSANGFDDCAILYFYIWKYYYDPAAPKLYATDKYLKKK